MRAVDGSCSKSHRICQIRPSTKPIAIATEVSKTITSTKVIAMFLSRAVPLGCPSKRLPDLFYAAVNRAGAGDTKQASNSSIDQVGGKRRAAELTCLRFDQH